MQMTAAEKIRLIMNRKGISLTELAVATGQTRQNLSNKISRNNFTEKELAKIAGALGGMVEIVFTLEDGEKI